MKLDQACEKIESQGGVVLGIAWYDPDKDTFHIATISTLDKELVAAIVSKFAKVKATTSK
jgi:hypothetical protein